MKKILFIINPIAGGSGKEKVLAAIGHLIDTEKYSVSIDFTAYAGHATELAASAVKRGVDIVVAVGGDGSVNEVAKALVGTSTALGIIPCGSGNGLARHLHIPVHLTGALRIINSGFTTSIDTGKMNGNPFFCTCGVGYDAKVCHEYSKAGTRGLITYVGQSVLNYLNYSPHFYRIKIGDKEIIRKALMVTCANANQWGNNFHVAPAASLKDGLFDLVVVHPIDFLSAIPMPAQILGYHFDRNSRVETFRCSKAQIVCFQREEQEVHYDGEPTMSGPELTVEMLPASLKVVISKSKDRSI